MEQQATHIVKPFTTIIEPRFSETDGLGHIGNTVVPIWFEYARTSAFIQFKITDNFMDFPALVVHINVDYIAQIYVESPVEITTQIARFGNTSMTFTQLATQKGKTVAQGECVLVLFDKESQSAKPIPAGLRTKLAPLLQKATDTQEK